MRAMDPSCAAVRREIRNRRMEAHINALHAELHEYVKTSKLMNFTHDDKIAVGHRARGRDPATAARSPENPVE